MSTTQIRQGLLASIIVVGLMVVVWGVGTPRKDPHAPHLTIKDYHPPSKKEVEPLLKKGTMMIPKPASLDIYRDSPGILKLPFSPSILRGPRDANHNRIIGIEKLGDEPIIDAGTSYTDYSYWSLYGWRTMPPAPPYSQRIVNTPFDETMRECVPMCYKHDKPNKCLMECMFKANHAQGTLMDTTKLLHEAKDVMEYEKQERTEHDPYRSHRNYRNVYVPPPPSLN